MGRWRSGASGQNPPADDGALPGPSGWDALDDAGRPAWDAPPSAPEPDILAPDRGAPLQRPRRSSPSRSSQRLGKAKPPTDLRFRERIRRWAKDPRAWVATLLVGAILGALAAHGYDARLAEQSRRDAILLSARVALDDDAGGSGRESWTLPIVLANKGETKVRLVSARLVDNRFQSSLRDSVDLAAGADTWISLDVSGACAGGGPATAPRELAVTVVAPGRSARELRVRLADDSVRLAAAARQTCFDTDFALWLSATMVGKQTITASALVMSMQFRLNGVLPQSLRAMRTTAPGLIAVAAPLPVEFPNGLSPVTTLTWAVFDCERARGIGIEQIRLRAAITLRSGDAPLTEVNALLDGDAVLLIVEFIRRSCG